MHEYVTVSSSSYDPATLATKLTEKSAAGWEVVSIVQTGGDVTAFLRRATGEVAAPEPEPIVESAPEPDPTPEPEPEPDPTPEPAAMPVIVAAPDPVQEPSGWASAPEPEPTPDPTPAAPVTVTEAIPAIVPVPEPTPEPEPAAAAPAVPAGWYADPSSRFELRYWDGGQWTEHVARGGQQFTDPPVA